MSTATTETVDTQSDLAVEEEEKKQGRFAALWLQHYDLVILPGIIIILLLALLLYIGTRELDTIEQRVLAPDNLASLLGQHLWLAALSTILVLVIAVPLGILLSRRAARHPERRPEWSPRNVHRTVISLSSGVGRASRAGRTAEKILGTGPVSRTG